MTVGVALSALLAAFLTISVSAALLVVAYQRVLRRRLIEELLRLSGPSIVRALLPQQVMTTFLSEIYGDSEANRDVVAGVLGGVGAEPHTPRSLPPASSSASAEPCINLPQSCWSTAIHRCSPSMSSTVR